MAMYAHLRRIGLFAVMLLSLGGAAHAQATFPLALETKVVEAAKTVTFIITSDGTFNLSRITIRQVAFTNPDFGFEGQFIDLGPSKVDATARKLTVTAVMENPDSMVGTPLHMLLLFGDVRVSFPVSLVKPFVCPASCTAPRLCVNKICVLPPTKCSPRCKPGQFCNPETTRCEKLPT